MTPGAAWLMDAPENWGSRSAVSQRARQGGEVRGLLSFGEDGTHAKEIWLSDLVF